MQRRDFFSSMFGVVACAALPPVAPSAIHIPKVYDPPNVKALMELARYGILTPLEIRVYFSAEQIRTAAEKFMSKKLSLNATS